VTAEEIAAGIETGDLALTQSFRQMDGDDWGRAPTARDPPRSMAGPDRCRGLSGRGLSEGTRGWVALLQAIRILEHRE
jgi:hypothetical protein